MELVQDNEMFAVLPHLPHLFLFPAPCYFLPGKNGIENSFVFCVSKTFLPL
jgi:hypothetical protein